MNTLSNKYALDNYANDYPQSRTSRGSLTRTQQKPPTRSSSSSAGGKNARKFILVTPQGKPMGHSFRNASPYAAAMKAASRGFTDIVLYAPDTHKIHRYCGCMRDIQEDEHTDYTRKHGITQRAVVKSVKGQQLAAPASVQYFDDDNNEGFYEDDDEIDY